ncbi:MAG: energy transducer TonB [Pyrinomonadaceae bacterium]|nr:energy transducer TonB [Pyrinomonadaceae bacterium]
MPSVNYPRLAKAVGIKGKANVEVWIDEDGDVRFAKMISGDEIVKEAVVEAAFQAKMPPLLLGGEPIKMKGILIFEYDFSEYNSPFIKLVYWTQ